MQSSNQTSPKTFHMSLAEPLIVFILSLSGIILAAGLFMTGIGDFIKTILLLVISVFGLVAASAIPRKLEIAGTELTVGYLVSKRIIAREDIDAYFLDEQGINRRTRKFVTIHLINGHRIKCKAVQEGNDSLLKALEGFTGLKPATEPGKQSSEAEVSDTAKSNRPPKSSG